MTANVTRWLKTIGGGAISGIAQALVEFHGGVHSFEHITLHFLVASLTGAALVLASNPLPPSS